MTKYKGVKYLSMVDYGLSHFAIWRKLHGETAHEIVSNFESVFLERGFLEELLLDNALSFHSQELEDFALRWGTRLRFRAAYKERGNRIVKCNHCTVKVMEERSKIKPEMVVSWYNSTPKTGGDGEVLVEQMFCYS